MKRTIFQVCCVVSVFLLGGITTFEAPPAQADPPQHWAQARPFSKRGTVTGNARRWRRLPQQVKAPQK